MKINRLEQRSRQTRKKILNAADKLFFSRGYSETSVDDICHAAGVTKGAFYHHFKSKEAIYRERFTHRLDHYLETHDLLSDDASAREQLLQLARCTFDASKECGKELIAQNMIGQLTDHTSHLFEENRPHTVLLTKAYEAVVREGLLPAPLDRERFFMLYACLMNGFLLKWASVEEADIDWNEFLTIEISLLLDRTIS